MSMTMSANAVSSSPFLRYVHTFTSPSQLKLQRAAKPQVRDKVSGVWYAYHPCGGALTVRREEAGARSLARYAGR